MSVVALVDIDAFFAQAEQVKRPELRGHPVVVGGRVTDRSVVASASYEARARGVKTAMPVAQAVRICPEATFLRGDFATYSDLSRRVMEACRRHTPIVQPVSLDEAFLDLTGCRRHYPPANNGNDRSPSGDPGWPMRSVTAVQRTIRCATGLDVSIGVATNRLVAKVASDFAKPHGMVHVHPGGEAAFLAPLPLKDLPGIGPRTAERLARYNLRTIGELAALPRDLLDASFGSAGRWLHDAARGRGSDHVDAESSLPKSISRETTFEHDVSDRERLLAMLSYLLQRACRQLRCEGLLAATVGLKLRYSDFRTVTRCRTIADPSDHDDAFYDVLVELFGRLYTRRVAIRLVGVTLSNLSASGRQIQLFDEAQHRRRSRIYASVDAVRERFGFSAVLTSRALDLLETHPRKADGFELPVACLSR